MFKKKAFTLIELLVVIAIIGLLATISVIALNDARGKARDAKRVADVKQVQTALELFFNDEGRYPTPAEFSSGSISSYSSSTNSTTTYMAIIPAAPYPPDGSCQTANNQYNYSAAADGSTYTISYCLGGTTGSVSAGKNCASEAGISGGTCWACGNTVQYAGGPYDSNGISTTTGGYYRTVRIDSQCWLRDNLAATVYNDNTNITYLPGPPTWAAATFGAYCWFNNDYATYGPTYGALYNFYAVNTGKLCPSGWHVPTDAEFTTLVEGQATAGCDSSPGWNCSPAGDKLKEAGATHWDNSNSGTNSTGFTALGSGYRGPVTGNFNNQGSIGGFWSSSISGSNAWYRDIYTSVGLIERNANSEVLGWSVRCLKD